MRYVRPTPYIPDKHATYRMAQISDGTEDGAHVIDTGHKERKEPSEAPRVAGDDAHGPRNDYSGGCRRRDPTYRAQAKGKGVPRRAARFEDRGDSIAVAVLSEDGGGVTAARPVVENTTPSVFWKYTIRDPH